MELALQPDLQRTLHEEIDVISANLGDELISYDALHKMKFLDMVVSEGLRKWSPAPQTDRICSKDYEMDLGNGKKITILKGQLIFLPIYHIHRDPEYYKNPDKFDPYRFSDENKESINPGAFLPFGSGPRTCIGSRFALMSAKLLLFNFFNKFTVETCATTPKDLTYQANMNFRIKEKVVLSFKTRK